jgi:hypothetical protein
MDPVSAEEENSEEAGLKSEGGECFIRQKRAWIGPDIRDNSLQFVPNSKAITTPDTTPNPKATPKILSQKSKSTR